MVTDRRHCPDCSSSFAPPHPPGAVEAGGVRLAGLDAWECACLADLLADCGEPRLEALAPALAAEAARGEVAPC